MKPKSSSELFIKNLPCVLPNRCISLMRPFKEELSSEVSLGAYYCLETLKTRGTATVIELAHQLRVPKWQVIKLVDKLVEHQFIGRIGKEDDRGAVLIRLMPGTVTYLDKYYPRNTAFIRALEGQLIESELEELNEAVMTLGGILPKLS